ncbi:hypothetical protein BJV85_000179 [Clostridium acetobutylicum]|uniref:Hypothetical secreted protein n=1 Tax=Clostridium acetobutylicum (strain ATCC 824 / DSM 792 / JCM 1419 / IAM 19013 / LMG 5710 / NBRC 13948 / NRRL B-527 / VKM B-1787 / 2291 / W) TaxID=272562 RepID=Q97CX5_CLOAB|nr:MULTISPECIES: hypothetical protein [Clostridium]AAK81641.1 Hypothetical secreted protein [Clostridium acetobutylicum ATCC 824]ADZ22765.1 Hypothetical secreted protein [Clostridium acetobutylicum EA 2018]AEI33014.1 hypothetical protein SMB_G3764 [Clostridium acetobutylicum DSM 1731]AWV80684.1 hypothetical protein DK921_11350 [Clostridium acetobutylicum]MBC2393992.1 hypothetical protein [Clostridium acetobutylicum]
MKKIFSFIAAISVSASLVGCGSSSSGKVGSSKKLVTKDSTITKIIENKVKAINDGKIDDYMKNYDEKSGIYKTVKEDKQDDFSKYKMKSSIEDMKILNKDSKSAQVQVIESNSKIKGPGFLDNRTMYVDYLKNINGTWKITNENVTRVEYKDPVYDTLYKNVKKANDKKLDDYMDTIDPTDNDNYNKIKDSMLDSFNKYDIVYTLEQADIKSKSDKDTTVDFVETSIDKKKSDYKDNRTTGVYHLRIVNGAWKIFKTEVKSTESIDKNGNTIKSASKK